MFLYSRVYIQGRTFCAVAFASAGIIVSKMFTVYIGPYFRISLLVIWGHFDTDGR